VKPDEKSHPKFKLIAGKELVLFPADAQLGSGRTVKMVKILLFYETIKATL